MEEALQRVKVGRSAGPDGIENEMLKLLKDKLTKPLTLAFNKILETEEIPDQWKVVETVLLHKKGKREVISNYRPISLTSDVS